jgi:PHD/YefM family antitoxin component YafN of YafNO toxin-antitoxin module
MVVMSRADYNGWTYTHHLMSTPEDSSHLLQAKAGMKVGKDISR